MADSPTPVPVKTEPKEAVPAAREWAPFDSLRREIEQIFDDFDQSFFRTPLRRSLGMLEPLARRPAALPTLPASDVVEKDGTYEITAELPGMDEKNIELKLVRGMLTIKGEKQEEKEETKKDYHLSERRYGSIERSFRLPEGIDTDKITASFKQGVLTVVLPKTPAAKEAEKKIPIAGA